MKIDAKIVERLGILIELGWTTYGESYQVGYTELVDRAKAYQFGTSGLNVIQNVFGVNSPYEVQLTRIMSHLDFAHNMKIAIGILKAAHENSNWNFESS